MHPATTSVKKVLFPYTAGNITPCQMVHPKYRKNTIKAARPPRKKYIFGEDIILHRRVGCQEILRGNYTVLYAFYMTSQCLSQEAHPTQ